MLAHSFPTRRSSDLEITEGLEVTASANGSGAAGTEPEAGIAQATGEPGAGTDGNGACAAGSTEQSVGSGKGDGSRKMEAMTPDVRVIAIDLARVGAAQELYDRMAAEGIGVDVVINNAGIFSFCDILAALYNFQIGRASCRERVCKQV